MDRREFNTVAPRSLLEAAPGATKPGMELRLTFETLVCRLFQDTGVRAVFVPRWQVGRDYTLRCIR